MIFCYYPPDPAHCFSVSILGCWGHLSLFQHCVPLAFAASSTPCSKETTVNNPLHKLTISDLTVTFKVSCLGRNNSCSVNCRLMLFEFKYLMTLLWQQYFLFDGNSFSSQFSVDFGCLYGSYSSCLWHLLRESTFKTLFSLFYMQSCKGDARMQTILFLYYY